MAAIIHSSLTKKMRVSRAKYGSSTSFLIKNPIIYLFLHISPLSCLCSSQEGIVERLFKWAQEAEQPLRIYATGLLAGAMENQDIAANYREENSVLVSRGYLLSQMSVLF